MHSTSRPPRAKRHYARRQSKEFCRRAILSVRVQEIARRTIRALASERGMSPSEYVARLLNDHLAQISHARGGLPALKDDRP